MTRSVATVLLCGACLIASAAGLLRSRRVGFSMGDIVVPFCSLGIGFAVQRDWLLAVSIALLFYGAYLAFRAWRPNETSNKQAFYLAFSGAAWFLLMTTHDYQATMAALVLGLYGPTAAGWVTVRTRGSVGLLIIAGATLFQLNRALSLL